MAKNKLTKKDMDEMCELYSSGNYNFSQIAKKFNISVSSASDSLKRRGFKKNTTKIRKYKINENFFKEINSNSAYFLGILYADGCVHTERNTVSISLKLSDKKTLQDLKYLLKTDKPLQYIKQGSRKNRDAPMWRLSIESKEIKDDLILLGCHPKKTKCLKFPKFMPDEYFFDFLRGYFDGDGCITIKKCGNGASFSILSTEPFLLKIRSTLEERLDVNRVKICKTKSDKIYYLRYSSKKVIKSLFENLYKTDSIKMQRKFAIFQQAYINNP